MAASPLPELWVARLFGAFLMVTVLAFVSNGATATPALTWRFGPPPPFGQERFDGETVTTEDIPNFAPTTYFLGTNFSPMIWAFDGEQYVSTGVSLPIPVRNYGIAKLRDREGRVGLYTFGGYNDHDLRGPILPDVQVYYPETNEAIALDARDAFPGRIPPDCVVLPAMGVAVVRNHAIVLGGLGFCWPYETSQTWIFDPTAESGSRWRQGPDLAKARGYITAAVVGEEVFAIGGDRLSFDREGESLKPGPWVEKASPLRPAPRWVRVADLPQPCDESQAFGFERGLLKDRIILAGCGQWPRELPDSYVYDITQDLWTATTPLNLARRNHAGAFHPTRTLTMLIVGGYGIDTYYTSELGRARSGLTPVPGVSRQWMSPVKKGRSPVF